MRPSAPHATLSQTGQQVAYVEGTRLLLIQSASGQIRSEELPHQASKIALSPDAHLLTVANHNTLSLFQVDDKLTLLSQAALPAKPYRLTTSADGSTLASFVYNDEEGVVGVWQGRGLVPVLGTSGHSLGETLPDFVWLDAPHQRFLIWGQQGTDAFNGEGEPYIRLFDYSKAPLTEIWEGETLTFAANGFVMPLTATTFAVYNRQQLSVYDSASPEKPAAHYAFDHMEKLVSSPDGRWIAWLWNTSEAKHIKYHLAALRLGIDKHPKVISFDSMGAFEKFAIADSGEITLIYGKEPKSLFIFQSKGEELVSIGEISVR
jgi:hypothetical protein